MRIITVFCLLPILVLVLSSGLLAKEKEKPAYKVVNEAEIYYGDSSDFNSPAIVDVQAVYNQIPEYQKIVKRRMDDSDPRYLILMRAASDKFRAGVEAAAEAGGYDCVGGLGSIKSQRKGKSIPKITALVIENLPE